MSAASHHRLHQSHAVLVRRNVGDQKVVVFVNTKRQCDNVASVVADAGYDCTMLHGGKSQVPPPPPPRAHR